MIEMSAFSRKKRTGLLPRKLNFLSALRVYNWWSFLPGMHLFIVCLTVRLQTLCRAFENQRDFDETTGTGFLSKPKRRKDVFPANKVTFFVHPRSTTQMAQSFHVLHVKLKLMESIELCNLVVDLPFTYIQRTYSTFRLIVWILFWLKLTRIN